jgi:hypothetical protein
MSTRIVSPHSDRRRKETDLLTPRPTPPVANTARSWNPVNMCEFRLVSGRARSNTSGSNPTLTRSDLLPPVAITSPSLPFPPNTPFTADTGSNDQSALPNTLGKIRRTFSLEPKSCGSPPTAQTRPDGTATTLHSSGGADQSPGAGSYRKAIQILELTTQLQR